MRKRFLSVLTFAALALAPAVASAYSAGITGVARPGFGCDCHTGAPLMGTVDTMVQISGLPEGSYTPGATYELELLVLGPLVPLNAGFNLEATGGDLQVVDDTAQIEVKTECTFLKASTSCKDKQSTVNGCWIEDDPGCETWDEDNPACVWCGAGSSAPEGECRPCSEEPLTIEATHTSTKLDPIWNLTWVAPEAGDGDVTFYMAGNSVDGVLGSNDAFDHWAIMEPITLTEGN